MNPSVIDFFLTNERKRFTMEEIRSACGPMFSENILSWLVRTSRVLVVYLGTGNVANYIASSEWHRR